MGMRIALGETSRTLGSDKETFGAGQGIYRNMLDTFGDGLGIYRA